MVYRNLVGVLVAVGILAWTELGEALAGGTLRIGRNEDSTTMDPIKTAQGVDVLVIYNIHASLVRSSRDGNDIIADLAESWTVSDDKLTFTFKLREAKFSDGSPVTAEDAVFSLARLRDHEESVYRELFQVIESLVAVDDKTLRIRLKEPSAPFLSTIAMYAASILPKAKVASLGDDFAAIPVGAGVYRIADWRRGELLALEPNEHHYAAPISKVDRVEWQVVPDDTARMLKVMAGELDAAIMIPFAMLPLAEGQDDIQVHLDPSTREDHILLNHENEWLRKKPIRQAINMALDLETITQLATFGRGAVANSLMPAGTLYHNPDNKTYAFDPEKATSIIRKEGATGASFVYVVPAGNVTRQNIATMVQFMLEQVGLVVVIKEVDPSENWSTLVKGDYDMAAVYWIYDMLDPDGKDHIQCLRRRQSQLFHALQQSAGDDPGKPGPGRNGRRKAARALLPDPSPGEGGRPLGRPLL